MLSLREACKLVEFLEIRPYPAQSRKQQWHVAGDVDCRSIGQSKPMIFPL
jgi:hypothetical protein